MWKLCGICYKVTKNGYFCVIQQKTQIFYKKLSESYFMNNLLPAETWAGNELNHSGDDFNISFCLPSDPVLGFI